jgi:hypothetical protein
MALALMWVLAATLSSGGEYLLISIILSEHPNGLKGLPSSYGFTSRQWGLALDNVLAHEVVLADGRIVQASASSEPDLYWVSYPSFLNI